MSFNIQQYIMAKQPTSHVQIWSSTEPTSHVQIWSSTEKKVS